MTAKPEQTHIHIVSMNFYRRKCIRCKSYIYSRGLIKNEATGKIEIKVECKQEKCSFKEVTE